MKTMAERRNNDHHEKPHDSQSRLDDSHDDKSHLVQRPNKSQLKRDSEHLLKIGEQLLALKASEIDTLDLPENLEDAIRTAHKISSRSGLKRQRLYIGKIMRQIDSEAVEQQIKKIQHQHDTNTAAFRKLESWRDRLLADDKTALTEIIESHPDIDRQHINQMIRQAKRELQQNKPPAGARKLFKYLKEITTSSK